MIRKKFNIDLPDDVIIIKDIFQANGFKLFVVGGAVRDALLGQEPKDFDLATDALPRDVERMLKDSFKMLPLGEAFGIWQAFTPTGEFEIATFREDVGEGRRPEDVKFTTIEGDVKRRDLTINALFFDIDTSEVVDFVGGIEDLENGVVRAVGKAADRFKEDKLRILRALRFAARFNCQLDQDIVDAIVADNTPISGDGKRLSNERIRDEFLKGLKTENRNLFLSLISFSNIWDWIFGTLNIGSFPLTPNDPLVMIAILLRDNDVSDIKKILNKQTFHNDEITTIAFLVALQSLSLDNVVQLKKSQFNEVEGEKVAIATKGQVLLFTASTKLDLEQILTFLDFELSVTGQDAMEAGIPKGPEMGKFIKEREVENFKQLMSGRLNQA